MSTYHTDSMEKIVHTYFAAFTRTPLTYDTGKRAGVVTLEPKPLIISPNIFRTATCPPSCGGCCMQPYSLVFLPSELPLERVDATGVPGTAADGIGYGWWGSRPTYVDDTHKREVIVNGKPYLIYADMQEGRKELGSAGAQVITLVSKTIEVCKHLNMQNGRCSIHTQSPMTCDFELIRILQFADRNVVLQKLFGRGWSYTRIDGTKGAACEMIEQTPEEKAGLIRRLRRLQDWTDYFELDTHLPAVIKYCETGPHIWPLRLYPANYRTSLEP